MGDAILVFDLNLELKKVPISILVEGRNGGELQTLTDVPPKIYPTRVANVETLFEKPGKYAVTVNIEEAGSEGSHNSSVTHRHLDIMTFPVTVALGGSSSFGEIALKVIFLALLIVGGVVFAGYPLIAKRRRSR